MKKILEYKYVWDITDNTGHLKLKLEGSNWTKWKKFENAIEFQIIISTLRDESPVFLNKKSGKISIQTTEEQVGENEF